MSTTVNRKLTIREPFDYHFADVDPTVDDDSLLGHRVGSRWINLVAQTEFLCYDNTQGAAVWIAGSGAAGADGADGQGFQYDALFNPLTSYNLQDVVLWSATGALYVAIVQGTTPTGTPVGHPDWELFLPAGQIGVDWYGAWDSMLAYPIRAGVIYQGSAYIAVQVPPVGTVPTNATYWSMFASKGDDGAPGADGDDGAPGVGVPTGGTAGQVLAKIDNTDYNTEWVDATAGSGDALTSNSLAQFAATTSAELRGVLSDETGTGLAYFQGGDLGTPSAGVATNLTGTASGLTVGNATLAATVTVADAAGDTTTFPMLAGSATGSLPVLTDAGLTYNANTNALTATTFVGALNGNADTVTTNANLTGPITSVGNATSIASQTGTGTKFVVDDSPTLITPVLGVATATTINKVTITAPATGSTLTIDDGFTLHATGNVTALSGSHTGTSSGTNTGDQTNISGNAGTVTTNANLTGPITSVGNATTIAKTIFPIATISADTTLADTHSTVLVDTSAGNVTATLPAAPTAGHVLHIKKISAANTLTIGRNAKNIDGAAANLSTTVNNFTFALQYDSTYGWCRL